MSNNVWVQPIKYNIAFIVITTTTDEFPRLLHKYALLIFILQTYYTTPIKHIHLNVLSDTVKNARFPERVSCLLLNQSLRDSHEFDGRR